MLQKIIIITIAIVFIALPSFALDSKAVTGQWSLDEEKSKTAPDGNTAGLMKSVNINDDGTFEALYGTKGTWQIKEGKLLVTYKNSIRKDEEAKMDGSHLKFPSPAMAGKNCYLKR